MFKIRCAALRIYRRHVLDIQDEKKNKIYGSELNGQVLGAKGELIAEAYPHLTIKPPKNYCQYTFHFILKEKWI